MRTTIDLPDDIFRRAKAKAALSGIRLKEFFATAIERSLVDDVPAEEQFGQKRPIPVRLDVHLPPGYRIRHVTNDEALFGDLDGLLERIDD